MRIGILLHPYGEKNPAGLGRTIFELTKAMIEGDPANEYIVYVKDKPNVTPDFKGNNWRLWVLGGSWLWLDRGFRRVPKADVYIFNTPILPLFLVPKNSIVIALDFAYWFFPPQDLGGKIKNWFLFLYHGYSLWRAKHVVAISESTKRDVMRLFKIPEKKISIMYLGYKPICAEPQQEVGVPEKFFLFAGIIKERKNVFNIVRAFREYRQAHDTHKLVIAGNGAGVYYEQIRQYVKDEGVEDAVVFFGHANDSQLSYMYRKAEALFFPSIAEGFGMPVVEAMDCGLPVITSSATSLPEVGGAGAIIVDPYNIKEMAEALVKVSTDRGFREQLIHKGFKQKQKFSWTKSAEQMKAVIAIRQRAEKQSYNNKEMFNKLFKKIQTFLKNPRFVTAYAYNTLRRRIFVKKISQGGEIFYGYKGQLYPEYLFKKNGMSYIQDKALEYCRGRGLDIGCGATPLPGAIGIENNSHENAFKLDRFADGSLDYVFSSHCVEHLKDWQAALRLWICKLKPGGILFTYAPHRDMVLWRPGEVMGYQHEWSPTHEVLNKFMEESGVSVLELAKEHDRYWSFYTVGRKKA